jgi:DNA-binding NarL/FixJ family response regulator
MIETEVRPVRLYVAEEQEAYRELYKAIFPVTNSRVHLLKVASHDANNGLRKAVLECHPDVLLVGTKHIQSSFIEELEKIRNDLPTIGIVLFLVSCNAEKVKLLRKLAPIGAGGMAIFLKQSLDRTDQLCTTIVAVNQGQVILDPGLAALLFTDKPDDSFLRQLTARELEILHLVSNGYNNTAIAQVLCIEIKTVQHHLNNMYSKLKAQMDFDTKHPRVSATRVYLEATGVLAANTQS